MKKYIIMASVAAVIAVMSFVMVVSVIRNNHLQMFFSSTEALSAGEEGAEVTCRCNAFLGHTCKADHNGSVCAGGINQRCWDYDGNC